MGRYLEDSNQQHNSTSEHFAQAEAQAFQHVQQALSKMRGCCLEDLEQAAFSYCVQSFDLSGVSIREEWARRKASKWAAWWDTKHRASRTKRPHTRYSANQARRGRQVSQARRGAQADVSALVAQIAASKGAKVSQIAEDVGRTVQHTRRLLKRSFSRLLVCIILGTFGKSSGGSLSDLTTRKDLKEGLPNVRLDEGAGPITAAPGIFGAETASTDEDGDELATIRAVIEATKAHLAGAWPALPPP